MRYNTFFEKGHVIHFVTNSIAENIDTETAKINHNLFNMIQFGATQNARFEINVLAKYHEVLFNGIIIKARNKIKEDDIGRVSTLFSIPQFSIIVNDRNTAVIFARNVTSAPKT